MFALKSSVSNLSLNHCSLLSLFDTYVCSILSYGCEVWGYHKGPDIEKIHLDFLRYVLGVRRNTNRVMLYFETGRMPLYIDRIIRMSTQMATNDDYRSNFILLPYTLETRPNILY